jgi:hypothetical protein
MISIALLLGVALSTGCAEAILSIDSYRTHDAYTEASLGDFVEMRAAGPVSKAEVLATLGPPIHVISQDVGEIFVYRRQARDTRTINLNPAMVTLFFSLPSMPLYFDSDTSGRDDTLMVFFDSQGRLRGESVNLGIGNARQSEATLVGEGVQERLE